MLTEMKTFVGKVITALGPVEPEALGKVMMHEHLHTDIYRWDRNELISQEQPADPKRLEYLLNQAGPLLTACHQYGCHAYVETTPCPWRAWPDVYTRMAEVTGTHIILCTGYYREMEIGTYWVKTPEDRIWPFVIRSSVEELRDYCIGEIVRSIRGTPVRAGAIKVASSAAELTEMETKTFRAAARAQQATGVHVTTHCTKLGAETSQLRLLAEEGMDIGRAVIGHTARHLMDAEKLKVCMEWMRQGANFLPTNLDVKMGDDGRKWRPLVEAIHKVFDAGLGEHLVLGLDSGYCSESGPFAPMTFLPPHPWLHLFTNTLPAFRRMGLTEQEEDFILRRNPQRIIPVQ